MKTTLLGCAAVSFWTVSAFGADLGTPMPYKAPPAPPPFTWTSCYAGGHVGGGWGEKDLNDMAGVLAPLTGFTAVNLDTSGYVLGGQIGCDYQFAADWVFGIEGAASGGRITGNTAVAQPGAIPGDNATFKETSDFLTSVTGRVGYAWDRWMPYAKGGVALVGDKYSAVGTFLGTPYDFEGLESRLGWTAGAGIEWALWDDWSIKLEYDYYGFGQRNVIFIDSISGNFGPENIKQNIQVVTLGLNFHVFAGP
jgi:outer membrane immunogenic protein